MLLGWPSSGDPRSSLRTPEEADPAVPEGMGCRRGLAIGSWGRIHARLSWPCGEPHCILGDGLGSLLTVTPWASRWVLGHGAADRPGTPVQPSRERWQWVGSVGFSCFPCPNRKNRKVVSGPGTPVRTGSGAGGRQQGSGSLR